MRSRLTQKDQREEVLLKVDEDGSVEIVPHEDGLLIKKEDVRVAYEEVSKKHH